MESHHRFQFRFFKRGKVKLKVEVVSGSRTTASQISEIVDGERLERGCIGWGKTGCIGSIRGGSVSVLTVRHSVGL